MTPRAERGKRAPGHSLGTVMDAVPSCVPLQVTVYIPQNKNTEASDCQKVLYLGCLGEVRLGTEGPVTLGSLATATVLLHSDCSVGGVVCQPVGHSGSVLSTLPASKFFFPPEPTLFVV